MIAVFVIVFSLSLNVFLGFIVWAMRADAHQEREMFRATKRSMSTTLDSLLSMNKTLSEELAILRHQNLAKMSGIVIGNAHMQKAEGEPEWKPVPDRSLMSMAKNTTGKKPKHRRV